MKKQIGHMTNPQTVHIPDEAATPDAFDTVERITALVRRFQKVEV